MAGFFTGAGLGTEQFKAADRKIADLLKQGRTPTDADWVAMKTAELSAPPQSAPQVAPVPPVSAAPPSPAATPTPAPSSTAAPTPKSPSLPPPVTPNILPPPTPSSVQGLEMAAGVGGGADAGETALDMPTPNSLKQLGQRIYPDESMVLRGRKIY